MNGTVESGRYNRDLDLVIHTALYDIAPDYIGVVIGLAGAASLTRVMSGLLYEVQPHDAVTFVGASLGLALLMMLASLIPAWRATQVEPIIALRMD